MTIHCPSCGHESALEQKFCRKCGFNLEPVSELVAAAPGQEAKSEAKERDRAILGRMFRWMMWGCLVLLIGLVLLVTGKAFDVPKFISPLAAFLLVGGTATVGYGVLAALRDGIASPKTIAQPTRDWGELSSASTSELPDAGIPIALPSVTERTTQLIDENAKPKA